MLVLTRRVGETLNIGDSIAVTVLGVRGSQVRIGINAPKNIAVHREEVFYRIKNEIALMGGNNNGSVQGEESELTGTIESIIHDRGYGFIYSESYRGNLYFHCTNTDGDFDQFTVGMRVIFNARNGERGPQALNVRAIVENASEY